MVITTNSVLIIKAPYQGPIALKKINGEVLSSFKSDMNNGKSSIETFRCDAMVKANAILANTNKNNNPNLPEKINEIRIVKKIRIRGLVSSINTVIPVRKKIINVKQKTFKYDLTFHQCHGGKILMIIANINDRNIDSYNDRKRILCQK
ncbi:MAG: hypothetical protein QM538_03135 [Methylacidiphilales bacterium]|nr:hypothetical protein [Candidatus Methylacidiphilales bacterium]